MDYGKAAYLKAEDLEARLNKAESEPKIKNVYTLIKCALEVKDGLNFDACNIFGKGSMTLIVKVTVNAYTQGSLILSLDDASVGRITFSQAGVHSEIIMNSVTVFEDGVLSFKAQDGFIGLIEAAEITLIGADAHIDRSTFDWAADTDGNCSAVLVNEDGKLYILPGEENNLPNKNDSHYLGVSVSCDAVLAGGVCYIVYTDSFKNLYGAVFDLASKTIRQTIISHGQDSISICRYKENLLIAGLAEGAITVFIVNKNFEKLSAQMQVETANKVSDVLFIKGSSVPTLIFYSAGKSYIKTMEDETAFSACVVCKIETNVEEKY